MAKGGSAFSNTEDKHLDQKLLPVCNSNDKIINISEVNSIAFEIFLKAWN